MSLVLDRRTLLPDDKPRVHAIVIGVSEYVHLPVQGSPPKPGTYDLKKLRAASQSAVRFCRWLVQNADALVAPIATIRLLVAPTPNEVAALDADPVLKKRGRATQADIRDALRAWKADQLPDDHALFFFVGHGVQRNRADMVLLCEDFAAPGATVLERAIDLYNVYDGLAREITTATIARTQLYFVDACRERPAAFSSFESLQIPPVFDVSVLRSRDDRKAPIFYATTAGALAYADPTRASLFSSAVLDCLDGAAAEPHPNEDAWRITSKSLERALSLRFNKVGGPSNEQECDAEHAMHDFVLIPKVQTPFCDVRLVVEPAAAVPVSSVRVHDLDNDVAVVVPHPLAPHPFDHRLAAGFYSVAADVVPATAPFVGRPQRRYLIEPTRETTVILNMVKS